MEVRLPVPAYVWELLPPEREDLIPGMRNQVKSVARRYGASVDDLWDEAISALIRATVYFKAEAALPKNIPGKSTPFGRYAVTAVQRACWRYCVRGLRKTVSFDRWLEDAEGDDPARSMPRLFSVPSAEELCIALETATEKVEIEPIPKRIGIGRPHYG